MDTTTEALNDGLSAIRQICRNGEHDKRLARIDQLIGHIRKRAGIEDTDAPVSVETDERRYAISVGTLQVEEVEGGFLTWVNDTEIRATKVTVTMEAGKEPVFRLRGFADASRSDRQGGEAEQAGDD